MGGITRTLFGGSKSKSQSSSDNQAYGTLLGLLKGNIGQGNNAMGTLAGLLGLGGGEESDKAFGNYLDSSNYKFLLDSGSKAITNNRAAQGMLRSGATGKALQNYGQDLAQTKLDNYISALGGLGQFGLNSAQIIGGAGQRSQSTSSGTSQGGAFNALFPKGLSDPRVKNFVKKLGEYPDGLEVWVFEYKKYPGVKYVGVNAEQVQKLRPFAMGPMKDGYLTVRYNELPRLEGMPEWGKIEETVGE